ncbi:hypothetical protein LV779_11810 [Streptomyces thinghirensis]|nr:hypothetical protein [Streptomyces thinghirensis]
MTSTRSSRTSPARRDRPGRDPPRLPEHGTGRRELKRHRRRGVREGAGKRDLAGYD